MLIDNITLAVFEDSGWYRINYTAAAKLVLDLATLRC